MSRQAAAVAYLVIRMIWSLTLIVKRQAQSSKRAIHQKKKRQNPKRASGRPGN
jgi:hypothetical protein